MITQSSIDEFLERLASGDPTPGGGSAAAIMGAMGAALVSMVCSVSIGKKGYEAVEDEHAGDTHRNPKRCACACPAWWRRTSLHSTA